MADTTYVSAAITTPGLERQDHERLAVLAAHIRDGTGGYDNMNLLSAVFDRVTKIRTIIVTKPIPPGQLARYNLTQV